MYHSPMAQADTLATTLSELNLNAQSLSGTAFDSRIAEEENGQYQSRGPRPRARQNAADLTKELEADFLTPSSQFSPEWLSRLQRCD
jgi:antiviral helicase SKI2